MLVYMKLKRGGLILGQRDPDTGRIIKVGQGGRPHLATFLKIGPNAEIMFGGEEQGEEFQVNSKVGISGTAESP